MGLIRDQTPVARAGTYFRMLQQLWSFQFPKTDSGRDLKSPLPINSDGNTNQPNQAHSEFLGRGVGGEGKTSHQKHPLNFTFR